MPVKRYRTAKFADPSPLIASGGVGLMLTALMVSPFFSRTVLKERVEVRPDATVTLPVIEPRASRIGALRIDVRARMSRNTWVTFEVQVRDRQGNPLAAAIKQAWQESGRWSEGGESGTWSESDTRGQLDLQREALNQPIQIAIASLEQGTTGSFGSPSSSSSTTSVSFDVTVREGVIDARFLWSGFWVGLLLSGFTWMTVVTSGQLTLSKTIGDSDVGGRARLGGPDKLVRAIVTVNSDETTPSAMRAELTVKDKQGNLVYEAELPLKLTMHRDDDGSLDRVTGKCQLDLVLPVEESYGFYVEVVPDAPVDRTTLKVLQNVRTLGSVEVVEIASLA